MNALYDKGREGFLDGSIDWDTDDIRVVLIRQGEYTVDLATHSVLSDIPSAARLAVSGALTGKTATAGIADADDVSIAGVPAGTISAVVIYQHTGNDATARLIAYLDTGTGLPLTVSANATVQVTWNNGANRIFKI